jgi:hypothetical protein
LDRVAFYLSLLACVVVAVTQRLYHASLLGRQQLRLQLERQLVELAGKTPLTRPPLSETIAVVALALPADPRE